MIKPISYVATLAIIGNFFFAQHTLASNIAAQVKSTAQYTKTATMKLGRDGSIKVSGWNYTKGDKIHRGLVPFYEVMRHVRHTVNETDKVPSAFADILDYNSQTGLLSRKSKVSKDVKVEASMSYRDGRMGTVHGGLKTLVIPGSDFDKMLELVNVKSRNGDELLSMGRFKFTRDSSGKLDIKTVFHRKSKQDLSISVK